MHVACTCVHVVAHVGPRTGADPEGGFGDLSPLSVLEVKIIKNVNGKNPISVEIFPRDMNGDAYF